MRVAGVMAHAQRGFDATLPLGLRASGTLSVRSAISGIVSLSLRVSGAIRTAEGINAILRLPLRTTGVIRAKDQITGSARLPFGVAGRIGHKVKPCSLLLDVFRPASLFGLGAHRYWRLSCTQTVGSGPPAIAALRIGSEDEWFDPSSAIVTVSSVNNGFIAANLFDNDLATIWAPNTQVSWVQFDFGASPVAAHRLGITPRNDVFSAAAQSMKAFALQWSDDGATWTNDWSVTLQVDWTESLEKIYARSVYGDSVPEDIEWSVSNDLDDPHPYLLSPKQYAAQDIDPIGGTASIGQIEVGAIDVPTVPGDQSTGWMTARVGDILGRRCRLKRYVSPTIGWVTIADGPAGAPKMDPSYSAYRWTIRDTREMERRLSVFKDGGYAAVIPSGGIVSGFGKYTDDTGDHLLINPVVPMTGRYSIASFDDGGVTRYVGSVSFDAHFTGLSAFVVDESRLVISDAGVAIVDAQQIGPNQWASPLVDVLWRIPGTIPWNIARVASTSQYRLPSANVTGAQLGSTDGEWINAVASVYLFFDTEIPANFPTSTRDLEVIVRSRAAASEDFPIYIEGKLGDVLKKLYDGTLSMAPTYGGALYDPAGLNTPAVVGPQIQYDPSAFDPMIDQVCLRKVAPETDARTWAESALYGPSGWIPSMDSLLRISPRTRNSPSAVTGPAINDANSVPAPNWNLGSVFISAIEYTYPRYFAPTHPLPNTTLYTTSLDGLATRQVTVTYDDEDADLRYGTQVQSFDASAFAAIGTPEGINLPGRLEVANGFAQTARFEVLQRYRAGVPAIALKVRRSLIASLRSGDWAPYDISWIPGALGNRSASGTAQIISIKDDDCIWRTVSLDLVPTLSEAPGYADSLVKESDSVEPGFADGLALYDDEAGA